MTGGSANRRRRQSEGAHHAGESRWPRKQQMNPAGTTRIRFRKVSAFPDSFLTPHRSPQNEGRTESFEGQSIHAASREGRVGHRRDEGRDAPIIGLTFWNRNPLFSWSFFSVQYLTIYGTP